MATLPSVISLGPRPTPQSGRAITGYEGGAEARAMEGAGQVAGQIANQLDAIDQRKQNAQAALTLAKLNNDLHDAHDTIVRGVGDGSLDPDQAVKQLRDTSAKLTGDRLQGMPERQRSHIADNIASTTGALERNLGGVIFKRGQSDMAATIDQMGEQAQRDVARIGPKIASEKFGAFVDFAGSDAGLNPATKARLKQKFSEGAHYAYFDAEGVKALTADDSASLKTLRERMNGPDGEPMDPVKRAQLTHQLYGYEQHIEAKKIAAMNAAEREQLKRDNIAVDYLNKAIDLTVNGNQFNPEFIKESTTAAAGTPHAAGLAAILSGKSVLTGFATKSAADRATLIERMRNAAADPAQGTDPMQAAMVKQLVQVNDNLTTKTKENPWTAFQSAGGIKDAPAFDMSASIGTAFQAVDYRMKHIADVETWAGHKVSPLQPQEAAQISTKLATLPPKEAAEYLGELGAHIGDPLRIDAVSKQLGQGKRPVELMMKTNDRTTAGRTVSELIGIGAQSLGDKTVKMDGAAVTGWRNDIATLIRGTLGNKEAEDEAIDSAVYVRAAMELPGVNVPGFNLAASADQAVKLVVGQPLDRGGVKTILPRGMDESAFTEKMRQYTPQALAPFVPSGVVYVRGQPRKLEQLSSALPGMGMKRNPNVPGHQYTPVSGGAFITLDPEGQVPLNLPVQ